MGVRLLWIIAVALALAAIPTFGELTRTQEARKLGERVWHKPCDGQVEIHRGQTRPGLVAQASWKWGKANRPEYFYDCQIIFDEDKVHMPYEQFCTIMVHEFGHLAGLPHSQNRRNVMYPYYVTPFDECRR